MPAGDERFGGGDLVGELLQLLGLRAAQVLQAPAEACGVTDGQTVEAGAQLRETVRSIGHSGQDRRLAGGVRRAGLRLV